MEIMQQGTSHIESRWRPHIIPYNSHGMTLPSLQDHLRQQMVQHQQSDQQQEHPTEQQQLQQSDHQLQQLQQLQHKQLIKQRQQQQQHQQQQLDVQCEDSAASRGPAASPRLPKLTRLTPLVTASSSGSPPSTASPGKSGGKDGEEKKKGGEWEQYNAGAAFLGPTLWDKTLSYDSDLKVSLEYMDLDEFLNENGIPAEENVKASVGNCNGSSNENADNPNSSINNSSSSSSNNSSSSNTSSNSRNSNNNSNSLSPEVPSSPENPHMGSGMGVVPQVPSGLSGAAPAAPIIVAPPALSPQDYSGDGYSSSPESPDPLSPSLQVHEPDKTRASQGREIVSVRLNTKDDAHVLNNVSGATAQPPPGNDKFVPCIDFNISPNDLALATVPGQDFDPRTRCFSEEELKPQPMIKKSRKQFVPHELKDDKYWARRRKNNMAAKRSRDARRLKENQIAMRANFLEKENNALTAELQKAQAVMESLKKRLAMYEAV
ncbi:hepatic leukemia factor isoform X2 [Procambarus clarkii]|uniref:hepatic leukemia factor isoform X2 n=1 Tax=Procambarus clarkii TaxID=6728 RepID=UPI001E67700F|nr:transcription factor VBP-like isoform X2 [Procambarus clarkii]